MGRGKHSPLDGWTRPLLETAELLQAQIGYLRTSCSSYDHGSYLEAARLATCVHILVHDGGGQRSLLTQLAVRAQLRFPSPFFPDMGVNLLGDMPLVGLRFYPDRLHLVPQFMIKPTRMEAIQFHRWWEKDDIFRTPKGETINRRRLTFALRSQDGGSHIDERLTDAVYVGISRLNEMGWYSDGPGNIGVDLNSRSGRSAAKPSAHLVAMRQIAWEIDTTLTKAGVVTGSPVVPEEI